MSERSNQRLLQSTPAEPNPPGNGEPVAWDYRYRYRETGAWSRWRRADTLEQAEYNGHAQTRESADIYEVRALYAAPLPSPAEGAGEQARIKELEAENARQDEQITSLQFQMFKERNICHAERQRREEAEEYLDDIIENLEEGIIPRGLMAEARDHLYRVSITRATATGGGDNG